MFKFVLLKWTSGNDIGMLSVLDTTCVRGYELLSFDGRGRPTDVGVSVVVEWRAGKKPKNGWPVYDAEVLQASDNESELEAELDSKRQEALLQTALPLAKRVPAKRQIEDSEKIEQKAKKVAKHNLQKVAAKESAESLIAQIRQESAPIEGDIQEKMRKLEAENARLKDLLFHDMPKLMKKMQKIVDRCNTPSASLVVKELEHVQPQLQPPKPATVLPVVKELDNIQPQIQPPKPATVLPAAHAMTVDVVSSPNADIIPSTSTTLTTNVDVTPVLMTSSKQDITDKIEVFPGSGVFCDRLNWSKAKHTTKASTYIRALLIGVFSAETLLVSCLKGGANKRDTAAEHKKALDPECLTAIYNAVYARFPTTQPASIGIVISQKLTDMRQQRDKPAESAAAKKDIKTDNI